MTPTVIALVNSPILDKIGIKLNNFAWVGLKKKLKLKIADTYLNAPNRLTK